MFLCFTFKSINNTEQILKENRYISENVNALTREKIRRDTTLNKKKTKVGVRHHTVCGGWSSEEQFVMTIILFSMKTISLCRMDRELFFFSSENLLYGKLIGRQGCTKAVSRFYF